MELASPLDTLRLSATQYEGLLAELNQFSIAAVETGSEQDRRQHERYALHRRTLLLCCVRRGHLPPARFAVRCYDLSSGGMSFLHGNYLHVNSQCQLTLITADRRGVRTDGRIVRCVHLRDHVHRVGVAFRKPMDIEALGQAAFVHRSPTETLLPLFDRHDHSRVSCGAD